jgi:hypothetical protein
MSDEVDDLEVDEEDEPKVPPAGYVPGAPAVPGQAVGDRGEVTTYGPDGEPLLHEEPGEGVEPV